jgi:hypothetical protein
MGKVMYRLNQEIQAGGPCVQCNGSGVGFGIDATVVTGGIVAAMTDVRPRIHTRVVDGGGSRLHVDPTVVNNLDLVVAAVIARLVLASEGNWAEGQRRQRNSRCDRDQTMLEHDGYSRW